MNGLKSSGYQREHTLVFLNYGCTANIKKSEYQDCFFHALGVGKAKKTSDRVDRAQKAQSGGAKAVLTCQAVM